MKEVRENKKYDFSSEITQLYASLEVTEEDRKENKPVTLAVLVRTNFQAGKIRDILEKMRESDPEIAFEVVTGGSLFASQAAKHLLILFNSLCYDRDPESYFALYQTPFTEEPFNPSALLRFEGDRKKIYAQEGLKAKVKGFREAAEALRFKPPLHVIYRFLMENPFEAVLASSNEQPHEIQKYRLNLYRILELASDNAAGGIVSMYKLRDWLELQVATNRDEDEMEADISSRQKIIRVLTVHKAKGLEFDTVFIPYTYQPFDKITKQEMIVAKAGSTVKAGWKVKAKTADETDSIESPLYQILKESEKNENIREEARLLYVALTRAKNRLVVMCDKPRYKSKNSRYNWSDLIRLGMGGK